MIEGLKDFSDDNLAAIKKLVEEGYVIKTVSMTDENYTESFVLLQHPETRVTIKVLLDNYFFEEFAKEYLINLLYPPKVEEETSDYYQLKLNLGDA